MERLVAGRQYRVQLVYGAWHPASNSPRWWPTIGPLHEDREFFHFERLHFHIDARFLEPRVSAAATRYYFNEGGGPSRRDGWPSEGHHPADYAPLNDIYDPRTGAPLWKSQYFRTYHDRDAPPPDPADVTRVGAVKWGMRKCHVADWPSPHGWRTRHIEACRKMTEHFVGQSLNDGMRCPHRGVDLSNVCPVNGVLECPAHGLQFTRDDDGRWMVKDIEMPGNPGGI